MPAGHRLQRCPGRCGSAFRVVVSLLYLPDSGVKRARDVVVYFSISICGVVMPAGQRLQMCLWRLLLLWRCSPICGVAVMQVEQRFQTCPGCRGPALRFVVPLLCQPGSGFKYPPRFCSALRFVVSFICQLGSGFKRARGSVVLPADLWFRCCASRAAVSNVPGGFGSALRSVVSLLGQPGSGFQSSQVFFWLCPPICAVFIMQAGHRLQTCPACCDSALKPDSDLKRAREFGLPSD